MLVDGFLALLDGTVEVRLAEISAVLVAYGIEGEHLCIVVLVALFFLQRAIYIGKCAIIIGIVSCVEGMPPSALRSILLRRASGETHQGNHSDESENAI